MKNFFSLSMIIAAAAISFISCQKQEFKNLEPVTQLSFISEKPILSDETKTEWNGSSISWSQGDRIRIAYTCDQVWQNADGTADQNEANGAKTAKLYESNPLTTAGEIGHFSIPGNFTSTAAGTYQFYGVYPSSICTDAPQFKFAPSLTVTIPTVQTPLADSFDPSADLMLGKSVQTYTGIPTEPVSIHWTRLVAHANITLSTIKDFGVGEKISTIELTANPEADMVDKHYILLDQEIVDRASSHATKNILTINGTNLTVDPTGTVKIWATMLPTTLSSLKIVVTTDKATYTREIPSCNLTFKQNARNTLTIKMDQAVRSEFQSSFTDGEYVIAVKDGNSYFAMNSDAIGSRRAFTEMINYNGEPSYTSNNKKLIWRIESIGANTVNISNQGLYLKAIKNGADMVDIAQASEIKYTSNQDGTFDLSCMVSADERHLRKNTTYGFGFYSTADPILLIPVVFEARPSIIVAPEELSQSVLPNGEMITINYSIENPVEGQTISVAADQTWINNLDLSTPGQLSFNIGENSQTTTRTGNIRISYKGAEDVVVKIEQKGISASGEAVIYILDATLNKGTNNNYNNNCDITADSITWNVTGNSTMQPWRIGGKSLSNVDRTVYSKTPFANPLNKVSLTLGKSTLSLNSVSLLYSANADFTGAIEVMPSEPVTENTTLTFTANFPANCYYKFVLNVTNSQTKNKYVEIVKIEFIGRN